ncbi:EpsG family protein [Flavobacterium sp. SUN046]|uniref:EpsG family protein n=1 Tax=Flavobacterium sp. SUN046 TaxID=3002440 RepID=UPI002DB692FA|nr:EpsG family protein [Flavobacterium sp. SUN046]MEC4050885.1 EpsG family protein [Flavobacterium sp. SUN046]
MINFIPIEYYTPVFYQLILFLVLITSVSSYRYSIESNQNLISKNTLGNILMIVIVLYMGLRPVSGKYFGDMSTYARIFNEYISGYQFEEYDKDIGFTIFLNFCTKYLNLEVFFILCSFLYVYPLYLVSKKIVKDYWYYVFFILVCSFSFWAAGVNGIRSGIASSFLLVALTRERKINTVIWLVIALSFHKSMGIPIIAFLIASYYKNTKTYMIVWLLAIPLSFILGKLFENLVLATGLFEDEIGGYFSDDLDKGIKNSVTGFRWDFIIYSSLPVFAGWYFVMKRKFEDKLYINLLNLYLIANTFWILIIRANFSNRFAFLSWFIMGIIIIYPLLKVQFFEKQHVIVARIILFYFMFTYTLNFLLAK